MTELKYSYISLRKFCDENSIELCRDYSQEIVRQKTVIEGKCKTNGCDGIFVKSFSAFLINYYCSNCVKIEKYKKVKETNLNKYGVSNPNKLLSIREKIKETNLNKYGTEFSFQNENIKSKIKDTLIERYGVDNPNKCPKIRKKTEETCLKKYGCKNPNSNIEVRNKIKHTCFEKYGFEHPSQHNDIKIKTQETFLKKYGVKNPTQHPEIAEKASNNSYQIKIYTFPSGNTIRYQGYEHLALDEIIHKDQIDEMDIVNSKNKVPTIWYTTDDGKDHRHYVDIFIPTQNRCIEVKSEWYFNEGKDIIMLKQKAAKELGYKYEIWVYNKKGEKINCYE